MKKSALTDNGTAGTGHGQGVQLLHQVAGHQTTVIVVFRPTNVAPAKNLPVCT